MVIALDFDGTLCEEVFPKIGKPKLRVFAQAYAAQEAGHEVVLWTCRHGSRLAEAVMWCAERGLRFDLINDDSRESKQKYGLGNRKIGADVYVDDKAPGSVEWFLGQVF